MNKQLRRAVIAGNWKMNRLPSETAGYFGALSAEGGEGVSVVLCVPFTSLAPAVESVRGREVCIGAQNLSQFESGAYTGEISAKMLADIGVSYVIIGHSERRAYFSETNESVNAKLKTALLSGLSPIVCIGETLSQRDAGETFDFLREQLVSALSGLSPADVRKTIIAYEPIWAIGTGRTASNEQAQEVCGFIRALISESFGAETAEAVSILYGGSMNLKNAAGLLSMRDIDGGLIGGASLKPDEFAQIIKLSYTED